MSAAQLWQVLLLFARRPGMLWPTYRSTRNTLAISSQLYGKAHKGNGPANAFRHALWNALLAGEAYKKDQDLKTSVAWAKKVTDLHENLAINDPLNRAMDEHNNAIGRKQFLNSFALKRVEMIEKLQEMAKNAQKVYDLSDIKKWPDQLIYI